MNKILQLIMLLIVCSGCMSAIDAKWAAVNDKARDANMAFAKASISFIQGVDEMVANKHGLQEAHIQRDWDMFYITNTDAEGKIYAELVRKRYVIADMDRKQLEESKRNWESYKAKYLDAIEKLKQMTISTRATEAEILEAKESAQAYLNSAISILGAAGGMAVGALLVP